METTLKQRLIGAAVIIALAVIFVPMILDGSGQLESHPMNLDVPPKPKFSFESTLPDPKELEKLPSISEAKQPKSTEESVTVETAKPAAKEAPSPKAQVAKAEQASPKVVEATANHIKPNPALSGWAVQVAAFAEEGKALALQDKLLADKYAAFTEKSNAGSKVVYRVKVGPELERKDAEAIRDKIVKAHGLDGSFVTNHP